MSMTRKDFVALASDISFKLKYMKGAERTGAVAIIKEVAAACRRSNEAFRYETFYTACGVTDEDLK